MSKKKIETTKPRFLLVEEYFDPNNCIAVDWSDLGEEVFNNVPSDMLYNISAVEEETGKLIERTVVYLFPLEIAFNDGEQLGENYITYDNGDIEIFINNDENKEE